MHADRAAVHEAADTGGSRGLDQVPGGVHVNLPVERVRHARSAEHRGQMEHQRPAFHRALDDPGIPYVPLDHFGAGTVRNCPWGVALGVPDPMVPFPYLVTA